MPKKSTKKPAPAPKAAKAPKAPKPAPEAPKATQAPKGTKINKSEFIRQHANLSAKEVVAEAAKQGIRISRAMVYVVWSKTAKAKGKPGRKPGRPAKVATAPKAVAGAKVSGDEGSLEAELRKIVLQVGLIRAQQVIDSLV